MARTKNRFNAVSAEYTVASDVIVPEKKYRVALYARLSVEKVSRPGNSIESQLDIMKAFISRHSEFQEYYEYMDNGYSGTTFERPEFNRMMDDVRSGKINCICVKDLSRFGRDYLETGNYIETIFPFMGVRFISVNDHFDTEQDYNENKSLEIALKNLVNDMYAKDISKRLVVTRKHEMERGKFTGSNAPYGYKVNESDPMRRFIVDEPYTNIQTFAFGKHPHTTDKTLYKNIHPCNLHIGSFLNLLFQKIMSLNSHLMSLVLFYTPLLFRLYHYLIHISINFQCHLY